MRFLVDLLNRLLSTTVGQAVLGISLAKHKQLCAELIWRAHQDQHARQTWSKPQDRLTVRQFLNLIRVDLSNTRRLKQIVAQHGWPGQSLVGPIGEQSAWLLAQHADHDLAFQQHCLALLEQAMQNQEAPADQWAYLTDRVRVAEGRPQVYGSQFHGALQPLPIEDETRVDERRAKVGLPPLADHVELMRQARAQQPSWSEWSAEMKRLLEQLPPSNEYEEYVVHLKHFLDTTMNL